MKKALKIISLFAAVVAILTFSVAKPYRIAGDCMEPAIADGKLYFLNRLSPYFCQYKAGDIIVFTYEGKPWISRIIALEEDMVHIKEGSILVNGVALEDEVSRCWIGWEYGSYGIGNSFTVPTDHVYVLSDNLSAQHDDSRVFGPIPSSSIVGLMW